MLLTVMSCMPLACTLWLKRPSSSVRKISTGLSVFPCLNTRTVAKGSPSAVVSLTTTPLMVVCAMAAEAAVNMAVMKKSLVRFIYPLFCLLLFD